MLYYRININKCFNNMKLLKTSQKNRIIHSILITILVFTSLVTEVSAASNNIEFTNVEVKEINEDSAIITWNTSINTTGKVYFGKSYNNYLAFIGDSRNSRYHEVELSNLSDDTKYYFQIEASNNGEVNKTFVYSFKTNEEEDTTKPQIKNIDIAYVGATMAVVTWETNEPASSRLLYDENKTFKKFAGSNNKVQSHHVIIKNLQPRTRYYLYLFSIDEDDNRSRNYHEQIFTKLDTSIETNDLGISHLRPSSQSDEYISHDSATIIFKSNHWANGNVRLRGKDERDRVFNLAYNNEHEVTFGGLISEKTYEVIIDIRDVFNKTFKKNFYITTKKYNPSAVSNEIKIEAQATRSLASCEAEYLTQNGFYGEYYNLPETAPEIKKISPTKIGEATGWYADEYFSFERIDANLDFGDKFFPVNEGKWKDPFYFSVYWRGIIHAPEAGDYEYIIKSDDDAVLYMDNELIVDLRGLHAPTKRINKLKLDDNYHLLEIYYADRGPGTAYFTLTPYKKLDIYPWPEECGDNLDFNGHNNGSDGDDNGNGSNFGINNNGNNESNGNGNGNGVVVAGAEYSYYTPATALYRTPESPDVYAIVNGQRHYISSPKSFNKYGYRWEDIRVISKDELEKYPRARLLRTPENPTIHYLYQRPESQWLKIDLNSPSVFISYQGNYWGNVIKVTAEDIEAYPKVKFLRLNQEKDLYYLDGTVKRQITEELFRARGHNPFHIVSVNSVHFEGYKTEEAVK